MSKLKYVVLEIGGEEVKLKIKEARELRDILNDLLGAQAPTYVPVPYEITRRTWPYRRWTDPYYYTTVTTGVCQGSFSTDGSVGDTLYLSNNVSQISWTDDHA
jgi:hypothetical protein